MTHRGPFQPLPFSDSVITGVFMVIRALRFPIFAPGMAICYSKAYLKYSTPTQLEMLTYLNSEIAVESKA